MTIIHSLRWKFTDPVHRRFVAERLRALKTALSDEIHANTSEHSLRLATWNLMHFGDAGGYVRTQESMLYIAEIIDHFDLVALQEVNRDLTALQTLVEDHLGGAWDYLVTDAAGSNLGKDEGNNERLAFLYRKAKVQFCKETGEIVLPEGQEIVVPGKETGTSGKAQFARTPFTVAFRSAWFKFKLCTVHIFFGSDSDTSPEMAQRQAEIARIAGFLAERQELERRAMVKRAGHWEKPEEAGWDSNYVLLGDFNIKAPNHGTMQALTEAGFQLPAELFATNLAGDKFYDQIAFKTAHPGFRILRSGVFDMLKHVYRDEDTDHYVDHVRPERVMRDDGVERPRDKQAAYFKQYYRRHQMSDHKLLWCEMCVDYSDDYLTRIIGQAPPTPPEG